VEVSRFKGLGEMPARQLKETTMMAKTRTLLRVALAVDGQGEERIQLQECEDLVERLMGRKAEKRFEFIQENAKFIKELDV
jgi:topoisomerase-4 subunit B